MFPLWPSSFPISSSFIYAIVFLVSWLSERTRNPNKYPLTIQEFLSSDKHAQLSAGLPSLNDQSDIRTWLWGHRWLRGDLHKVLQRTIRGATCSNPSGKMGRNHLSKLNGRRPDQEEISIRFEVSSNLTTAQGEGDLRPQNSVILVRITRKFFEVPIKEHHIALCSPTS